MAYFGQDIEQVQQLANQLNTKAGEIEHLISQLTATVDSIDWQGPDAERFRSDWKGQHTGQLRAVVSSLQSASQDARRNAQDQQTASGR
jgi:ABC-type transporter Mla subunit MlaD